MISIKSSVASALLAATHVLHVKTMQPVSILINVRVIFRISAQSDSCYRFLVTINMFSCFHCMTITVINVTIYNVIFQILFYFPDILGFSKKNMFLAIIVDMNSAISSQLPRSSNR